VEARGVGAPLFGLLLLVVAAATRWVAAAYVTPAAAYVTPVAAD
jgi:hypothetical protein